MAGKATSRKRADGAASSRRATGATSTAPGRAGGAKARARSVARSGRNIHVERDGAVLLVRLDRPEKRNALADPMVEELDAVFASLPAGVGAVVMHGAGEHFCAGLDLSMLRELDAHQGAMHSRGWHAIFDRMQFGRVPVIAALHGAVIGGGLEIACTAHIRVADESAFYALPEGQRGIFVGGGGAARLPPIIGAHRMADMMLTGRVLTAQEGQALGISTYLEPRGRALDKAVELARKVAGNAPATNFAVTHVLPRIAELGRDPGLLMESLIAGIAQNAPEAKRRMRDFLEKRAGKVKRPD